MRSFFFNSDPNSPLKFKMSPPVCSFLLAASALQPSGVTARVSASTQDSDLAFDGATESKIVKWAEQTYELSSRKLQNDTVLIKTL